MIEDVLGFWFGETSRPFWFSADTGFDRRVAQTLGALRDQAAAGSLDRWAEVPEGALALVILLDQAPRNVFRGTPRAFATDMQARAIARRAEERGFDRAQPDDHHRCFLYLPFEHSEDIADQRLSVRLFDERVADPEYRRYARRHMDIIARFGRFPHRNACLGRPSTPEEESFLMEPGSSF